MKRNKRFVITVAVIILVCLMAIPAYFVMLKLGMTSIKITDNYSAYSYKYENNVFDVIDNKVYGLENEMENRVINYFPLYFEANSLYSSAKLKVNSLLSDKKAIYCGSNGNEKLFYNQENDFMYAITEYSDTEIERRFNQQVEFFNSLDTGDAQLYLYYPTIVELTDLTEYSKASYIERFEKQLNSDITVGHMTVNDYDTYKKFFFSSDHHWSAYGATDGYNTIMNMLLGKPENTFSYKKAVNKKTYGSLAKDTMLQVGSDDFYVIDVDNNLEVEVPNYAENWYKPLEVEESDLRYYDYYIGYYNGQYDEVILHNKENEDGENIMIICDSFAWPIDYLIGQDFKDTYVINFRYGRWHNEKIDIAESVKAANISKVLFIYDGMSLLFDSNNYDFAARIE